MMRKLLSVTVITMAVAAMSAKAVPVDAAEAGAGKDFALIGVGQVDPAVLLRVEAFVEQQLAVPVRVLEAKASAAATLHDEGVVLAGARADTDVAVVALVWPETEQTEHAVYLYEGQTGVINARLLKEGTDDETYARRLDKLVVRSFALLLGLDPVPNPQSALYPYRTIEELDAIARTMDPPSLQKFQKAASERGVKLIESSPFFSK